MAEQLCLKFDLTILTSWASPKQRANYPICDNKITLLPIASLEKC